MERAGWRAGGAEAASETQGILRGISLLPTHDEFNATLVLCSFWTSKRKCVANSLRAEWNKREKEEVLSVWLRNTTCPEHKREVIKREERRTCAFSKEKFLKQ